MSDEDDAKLEARLLRVQTMLNLIRIAQRRGEFDGALIAYRDINTVIDEELAQAEDELTRSPTSDIVVGEIMAFKRLSAHFSPAPALYEQHILEQCHEESPSLARMLDRLRELVAKHQVSQADQPAHES